MVVRKNNNEYMRLYRSDPTHRDYFRAKAKAYSITPRGIWSSLFRRKKKDGERKVNISPEVFVNWYTKQKQQCFYCGISSQLLQNIKDKLNNKTFRLSIDRTDTCKPYELGNIVLCCMRCNFIKGDFFTKSEMVIIGKMVKKHWDNKIIMDKINAIFAKGSFTSEDIEFLMKNKADLSQDHLVRLGLVPNTPVSVVKEPVKEVERPTGEALMAKKIIAEQEAEAVPKKRGRKAKL